MRNGLLTLTFALFAAGATAQTPTIPQTAPGRVLGAWLEAFNSADRARIESFVDQYGWPSPVDAIVSFRAQTGGLDLIRIERSTPEGIEFVVKERGSETHGFGRLLVSGDPPRVGDVSLRVISPGAEVLGFEIDGAMRNSTIDGAMAKLREFYVYEETAAAMAEALDRRRRAGEYDTITSGPQFATLLTTHLREVSHDLHLRVNFSPVANPRPSDEPEDDPDAREQYRRQMERINCGFEKTEILPGNVGYLKFNMFADPSVCGPTAAAAMNFLQHVDALIVDMRENGGGDPAMVAYVTSYLFNEPTHLNDLYNRSENSTHQWWTLPHVPGGRLAEQPVYVLTARRTFSGAEEFTYNLKSLGRATIVGETTGGGAHPVRGVWLNEQFTIGVPFARAINPITQTNWEGTGVEPDVAVPADQALDKARELIAAAGGPPTGR
jgi:hypothetical protein